jgi:hypothetical protein
LIRFPDAWQLLQAPDVIAEPIDVVAPPVPVPAAVTYSPVPKVIEELV